jgi:hypothetical protein
MSIHAQLSAQTLHVFDHESLSFSTSAPFPVTALFLIRIGIFRAGLCMDSLVIMQSTKFSKSVRDSVTYTEPFKHSSSIYHNITCERYINHWLATWLYDSPCVHKTLVL